MGNQSKAFSIQTHERLSWNIFFANIFSCGFPRKTRSLCASEFSTTVEFGISDFRKAELTLSSLPTNYNSWNLLQHENFSTFVKLFVDFWGENCCLLDHGRLLLDSAPFSSSPLKKNVFRSSHLTKWSS